MRGSRSWTRCSRLETAPSPADVDELRALQLARLQAGVSHLLRTNAFGGAERLGALAISGAGMSTEQRVRSVIDLEATVLLSTPTYALRMVDVARELGADLASSALRVTIHAGEPGASIPATRAAIES